MSRRTLHRTMPIRLVRAHEEGDQGLVEAAVLTYNTIDDYDTVFAPGVFNESLANRNPTMLWSHDWADPIGRWTGYREENDQLILTGYVDLHEDVPRARQAWAQMRSGTLDEFSVGFRPTAVSKVEIDGRDNIEQFDKGELMETSVVIMGAVPGTQLVALRAPGASPLRVNTAHVSFARILQDVESGVLTAADALGPLARVTRTDLAVEDDTTTDVEDATDDDTGDDDADGYEPDLTGDTTNDADATDDVDESLLPTYSDADLVAWAQLADNGSQVAADELSDIFGDQLDPDAFDTWAEACVAWIALNTSDEPADDGDDDDGDVAAQADEDGGTDEDATTDAELEAELEAALSVLDKL